MRKICAVLGIFAMSGFTILPSITTNSILNQKKLEINKRPTSKIPGVMNKISALGKLKIKLDITHENMVYFKDRIGNIFYEQENRIYILKRDWLSWPQQLDQITAKVQVIIADNDDNIYFGTTNGIYKISADLKIITKIKRINGAVNSLAVDKNNNLYCGTEQSVYRLNKTTNTITNLFQGWVNTISVGENDDLYIAAKNGVYKLVAGTDNVLELSTPGYHENELLLDLSKDGKGFNKDWTLEYSTLANYNNSVYKDYKEKRLTLKVLDTFNLRTINPLDYKKIEFVGNSSEFYSKISWGNDSFNGKNPNEFNGSLLKEKILNKKLSSSDFIVLDNNNLTKCFEIQNFNLNYRLWGNKIWGKQYIILSYYFKNGNYYLQFSIAYNILTQGLYKGGGGLWMGFGHGIRLYND